VFDIFSVIDAVSDWLTDTAGPFCPTLMASNVVVSEDHLRLSIRWLNHCHLLFRNSNRGCQYMHNSSQRNMRYTFYIFGALLQVFNTTHNVHIEIFNF
jgi:hypothetical protein